MMSKETALKRLARLRELQMAGQRPQVQEVYAEMVARYSRLKGDEVQSAIASVAHSESNESVLQMLLDRAEATTWPTRERLREIARKLIDPSQFANEEEYRAAQDEFQDGCRNQSGTDLIYYPEKFFGKGKTDVTADEVADAAMVWVLDPENPDE